MGRFHDVELDDLMLTGERVTLRPALPDDAVAVAHALRSPAMHRYLALPDPYTPEDGRQFATVVAGGRAAGGSLEGVLVETATGALVGAAGIRLRDSSASDLGYWVAPEAQGRGFATEATRLLAGWAHSIGVHRIELICEVRNVASARVALRAGFGYEGVRRAGLHRADTVCDVAVFAHLTEDAHDAIAPVFARLPSGGLADGTLRLRGIEPDDVDGILAQEQDLTTMAMGFTGTAPPRAAVERMAQRAGLQWLVGPAAGIAMIDEATGGYAGSMQLRASGPPGIGGVGYVVHPDFRGRGYTTRALRLLGDWALDHGFERLELGARTANVASQRAARAAGWQPEGVMAARLRSPSGVFDDEVRFALVRC